MYDHRDFFLKPEDSLQRQYETLRAFYVDKKSAEEVAYSFGLSLSYFNKLRSLFHQEIANNKRPLFFIKRRPGPKEIPLETTTREKVIELRKKNYSIVEIKAILNARGIYLALPQIRKILKQEGFSRLPRRTKRERNRIEPPVKIRACKVERLNFEALDQRTFDTRYGGIFLFLPFIKRLRLNQIVEKASYPETSCFGSFNYCLSFLLLKLIDKERLSHVDHLSFDAGCGLFAGLNLLPKSSSLSSYSYKIIREMNRSFLKELFIATQRLVPPSGDVNLDFTAIPHWGDESILEHNWSGKRRTGLKSVLALIAQDPGTGILPYSNAQVRHKTKNDEVLCFIDFWAEISKESIKCLIFDSKFTTYENLSKLNSDGIKFITLRRRGKNLVEGINKIFSSSWKTVTLENLKRKYRKLRVYDSKIHLQGYKGRIRQIIVTNHGRELPAFIITNDFEMSTKDILTKYARRWLVEKGISEQIDFFHLNMVSSSIVVKVDFDLTMTLLANTLYRLLGKELIGFEDCTAKSIFSKFIDNGAGVQISYPNIKVNLRKKAHNPIISETEMFNKEIFIPWYGNYSLRLDCQNTT